MDSYYLVGSIEDISSHANDGLVDCELFVSKADAELEVMRRRENGKFKIVMFKIFST